MPEVLRAQPIEQKPTRPRAKDLEPFVTATVDVAEHEWTHIIAIWPKSIKEANVIPSGPQLGVTIPGDGLTPGQMQIAAMASAHHEGNGSDKMKAYILQFYGGMSIDRAESIAQSIVRSYHKDVLRYAAVYLAYYKTANDSQLRQFMRWAEEDVREKEEYKDIPIPSWSDEFDERRQKIERADKKDQGDFTNEEKVVKITYEKDGFGKFVLDDGAEKIWFPLRHELDGHKETCAYSPEQEKQLQVYEIFSADLHRLLEAA